MEETAKRERGRPPKAPPEPIPDTMGNIVQTVVKTRTPEELKRLREEVWTKKATKPAS